MSKFKIGDKVKIVRCYISEQEKFINTIHEVIDTGYIDVCLSDFDDDNKHWMDDELEHVTAFDKLVDKVKDVHENGASFEFKIDNIEFKKWFETNIKPIDVYIKNEEENEMSDVMKIYEDKKENKVLKLWDNRKVEEIELKYNDLVNEYIEKHYETTKKYKDLIEKFEEDLETLYKEETENKEGESSILRENNTCNVFKYVVDEEKLRCEAHDKYRRDRIKELDEQAYKYNEINALLSMSEDLEYQQSILIEYGIIDKKTKRMINEDSSK